MVEDPKDHGHGAHEQRDVRLKPLVISGIAYFALAFVTLLFLRPVFHFLVEVTKPETQVSTPEPEVRAAHVEQSAELSVASGQQLRELRGEEDALLHTYGWADRERGAVRIPIERAMEILKLPAREAPAAEPAKRYGESNGWNPGGAP